VGLAGVVLRLAEPQSIEDLRRASLNTTAAAAAAATAKRTFSSARGQMPK
jgi:hypothetical protein